MKTSNSKVNFDFKNLGSVMMLAYGAFLVITSHHGSEMNLGGNAVMNLIEYFLGVSMIVVSTSAATYDLFSDEEDREMAANLAHPLA